MRESGAFRNIKFDEYKRFSEEEKDFYTYEQLKKIDRIYETMSEVHNDLDNQYAKKWVEHIIKGAIGLILLAFFGVVIAGVIPQSNIEQLGLIYENLSFR